MIGVISLVLLMILMTYDNWRIKNRLDKLEKYLSEEEEKDENN